MNSRLQLALLSLLVLICFNFFDATFLRFREMRYVTFLSLATIIVISMRYFLRNNAGFVFPIQLIVVSIFVSIFTAYTSWKQSFLDSFLETLPHLTWIVFFLLLRLKISIESIEKTAVIFGIIYASLYFFQLANSNVVLFGKPISGEEFSEQRGFVRIIFPGTGIFILAIFIAINKLTTKAKGKIVWAGLTVLGVVIPVLQVTRQFIAGVVLIYLFHFLRGRSLLTKAIAIIFVCSAFLYVRFSDNQIIRGLSEVQERDSKLGKDYIRVKAGEYFLTDFSPDRYSQIFGNGAPAWGISNYGIFIEQLADRREFFISDVGIIGMYAMFGILSIVGYILIWFKSITIPLPRELYYLKYYLWYLLFTSLTWYSVYHHSYLIATVFTLYIYQAVYADQKLARRVKTLIEKRTQSAP